MARRLLDQFVARLGGLAGRGRRARRPQRGALLNINIPDLSPGPPKGVKVVPQSLKGWREKWDARRDPRGRTYYWITGDPQAEDAGAETDVSALAARYVTVTPLQWDLTDHARLEAVRGWRFSL